MTISGGDSNEYHLSFDCTTIPLLPGADAMNRQDLLFATLMMLTFAIMHVTLQQSFWRIALGPTAKVDTVYVTQTFYQKVWAENEWDDDSVILREERSHPLSLEGNRPLIEAPTSGFYWVAATRPKHHFNGGVTIGEHCSIDLDEGIVTKLSRGEAVFTRHNGDLGAGARCPNGVHFDYEAWINEWGSRK